MTLTGTNTYPYSVAGFYRVAEWDSIARWIRVNVGEQNCVWPLNPNDWQFVIQPTQLINRTFWFKQASDAALFELAWPSV